MLRLSDCLILVRLCDIIILLINKNFMSEFVNMKYEKSCGAIVYTNINGKRLYLVEQMIDGHWGVPKGHVEGNEKEEETALREIKEEVGLDVIIDTSFRTVETYSPEEGVIKDVVYFVAYSKSMDTTMQVEEIMDIKWVELKEAIQLIGFQDMQEIMMMADIYLSKIN
jgi:8-oxo-dGTP pyrophosphatase MutT (NUDIX family)